MVVMRRKKSVEVSSAPLHLHRIADGVRHHLALLLLQPHLPHEEQANCWRVGCHPPQACFGVAAAVVVVAADDE
jgi:hypothetical protein